MPDFKFIGFHEKTTDYYGAKCGVCGETMERFTKCMYNGITKEFRHFKCHSNHPANLTEIWLVDIAETNEDTYEPEVRRAVVHMSAKDREKGGNTQERKLIQMLASYPQEFTEVVQVMKDFRAQLGITKKPRY